jgi:hypothetical protein
VEPVYVVCGMTADMRVLTSQKSSATNSYEVARNYKALQAKRLEDFQLMRIRADS